MVESVIKTFKLNYDGTFDEVAYENLKEVFTIVNILAIYIQKIKTMYIWIGRNATQALKNHVARIRVIMKEEFPQFRIIRNITFDMRSETYEFFKNLNITKEELYEIINYQEKTVLPVLDKIVELKEKSKKSIESKQYKSSIELLKEIIGLAEEIQDDALVTEQKRLISKLTGKFENQQIVSEIEQETERVEKEYIELIKAKRILNAHEFVEAFIKKYETVYDLSLIPSAKELILKEKKKWNAEQEKMINDLSILEKDFKLSLENLDISEATEIYEKALNLFSNLIGEKIKNKWKGFSNNIQEAKNKLEFIKKFDSFSGKIKNLKETHQYNELKSKIENLIKQVEQLDLPEYRGKLNMLNKEVDSTEESYNRILKEIRHLEEEIIDNQKNNQFEKNLRDCKKIVELGKSINKSELIKNYTTILEQTKEQIKNRKRFEEKQIFLKVELTKLEKRFTSSIKTMKIKNINEILEKGEEFLNELVDDEIKEKWDNFKAKSHSAKQLLENVEMLSKNGMDALNKGSSPDSLNFFEQIIHQLQEYKS